MVLRMENSSNLNQDVTGNKTNREQEEAKQNSEQQEQSTNPFSSDKELTGKLSNLAKVSQKFGFEPHLSPGGPDVKAHRFASSPVISFICSLLGFINQMASQAALATSLRLAGTDYTYLTVEPYMCSL